MYLAINQNGTRLRPQKNHAAFCPACKRPVIAKMGKVKVHHWAHKVNSGCNYGRGMTEWHYQWIDRHFEKGGWEVEFIDGRRRYDCFNKEKGLVLEIQKVALYDYIVEKSNHVIEKGLTINWIFHMEIFKNFKKHDDCFQANTFRRLVILDIIEMFKESKSVNFYVDSLAHTHRGKSSKGLLKLLPNPCSGYSAYYTVQYVPYQIDAKH